MRESTVMKNGDRGACCFAFVVVVVVVVVGDEQDYCMHFSTVMWWRMNLYCVIILAVLELSK